MCICKCKSLCVFTRSFVSTHYAVLYRLRSAYLSPFTQNPLHRDCICDKLHQQIRGKVTVFAQHIIIFNTCTELATY